VSQKRRRRRRRRRLARLSPQHPAEATAAALKRGHRFLEANVTHQLSWRDRGN
jgi:hypothetical protein